MEPGLAELLFCFSLAGPGGVARGADQWEVAWGGTCAGPARELVGWDWGCKGSGGTAGRSGTSAGRETTPYVGRPRSPRSLGAGRCHVGRPEVSSAALRSGRGLSVARLSRGLCGPTRHPA